MTKEHIFLHHINLRPLLFKNVFFPFNLDMDRLNCLIRLHYLFKIRITIISSEENNVGCHNKVSVTISFYVKVNHNLRDKNQNWL